MILHFFGSGRKYFRESIYFDNLSLDASISVWEIASAPLGAYFVNFPINLVTLYKNSEKRMNQFREKWTSNHLKDGLVD